MIVVKWRFYVDFYDHKSATNTVNISTVLLITVKVKLILKHAYKKTFQFIHTIKPIDPTYTFVWGLYLRVYQCQVNSIEVFLVKLIPFHGLQEEGTIQNSFSVRLAKD